MKISNGYDQKWGPTRVKKYKILILIKWDRPFAFLICALKSGLTVFDPQTNWTEPAITTNFAPGV